MADSLVTKPPILNSTGQAIAAAIRQLTNTDATLSDPSRPANAYEVGSHFKQQGDVLKSQMTILQNVLNGIITHPIYATSYADMKLKEKLYIYNGENDEDQKLFNNHWYYYGAARWNDGGNFSSLLLDASLVLEGAAAEAKATGEALAKKLDILLGTENEGKFLKVNDEGNVDLDDVDTTLTIEGAIADAKATGEALAKKLDVLLGIDHADKLLKVNSEGNVDFETIDATLTLEGAAAEAKATGEALTSLLASINNRLIALQNGLVKDVVATENEDALVVIYGDDATSDPISINTGSDFGADELYYDNDRHELHLRLNGEDVVDPVVITGGGGGGGGDVVKATLSVENQTGWLTKTIAGGSCPIKILWSSTEDGLSTGDGTISITVNNISRATLSVQQGNVEIDLAPYLSTGINKVKVRVSDIYDQARTITFNVTVVQLNISSNFDTTQPYSGDIIFSYTPSGSVNKVVHFIIDGVEVATQNVSGSRTMTQILPAQSHGGHSLQVYFSAIVNEQSVDSNKLYYEFISIQPYNNNIIIVSPFNTTSAQQYSSISIPFTVYDPNNQKAEIVQIYVNGTLASTLTNVERSEQSYTLRLTTVGENTFKIKSGTAEKTLTFNVTASDIHVEPVTNRLELYLTAAGRTNNDEDRDVWVNSKTFGPGEIQQLYPAEMTNFTWRLDGWQKDEDGINVLRVTDDARVTIPFKLFGKEALTNGKTIEIEFATREVANYNATILSCLDSMGVGLKITPQSVTLKGQSTPALETLYKDNEHIRLTITIEPQSADRLLLIYIDGIMSRAIQYAVGDSFKQNNPLDITIGSDDCTIDIYNIRVYDAELNPLEVVDNWIADTQIGTLLIDRYNRNQVYTGNSDIISPASLPVDLPYFILEATELPDYKGDKKTIKGSYTDRVYPSRSFTFEGCEINVQGTSSSVYYRKNYDLKFKQGFITTSGTSSSYALKPGSIPFNRFVLKADVASSESTNNTGLTSFYSDTCPYKTPEQEANSAVRQGIEGIPIVVFHYNPDTNETKFLGKFNFNLPKRAAAPLGFSGDMESWEWQRNNSANVKFQAADFESTSWDADAQAYYPTWYDDFEARFPDDTYRDISQLNEFLSWVVSTWREEATGNNLPQPITYILPDLRTVTDYSSDDSYTITDVTVIEDDKQVIKKSITFAKDTPAYRLSKFKAEASKYVELESAFYYYLFTETFLMIDSRAKNMFPSFNGSPITESGRLMRRKVVFMPYDMDTALGTNNSGVLMFGYALEDTDHVSEIISGSGSGGSDAPVFNAQDSVFWCNLRDAFVSDIGSMYRKLRSGSPATWSYEALKNLYENHQSKWSENIFNSDAKEKYLVPLTNPVTFDEDTGQYIKTDRYLTMLQGSKAEQRKWWLFNRFKYMDSKYNTGSAASSRINLRLFNSGTLTITPTIDMYVGVSFGGGTTVQLKRTTANNPVSFEYAQGSTVTEMETWINSADMIADVGDLSQFYPNELDFSKATRLKRLQIGNSANGYSNDNLTTFDVQNSTLLEYIDVRNCPKLAITVNLEGSPRLKEAYFDNTKIAGVDLVDGCPIQTLHLPSSINSLTLLNLNKLADFQCPTFENVTRLMLANMDTDIVDPIEVLQAMPANSQVSIEGINMEVESAEEIETFFDLLDTMRGVSREKDSRGNWMYHDYDTAQVSGVIHTDSLTGAQIAAFNARYPYIRVTADTVTSQLKYYNWDGSELLYNETIINGANGHEYTTQPTRESIPQYSYEFIGWNTTPDSYFADPNALKSVLADRNVYAAYERTVRTYTVTWKNSNGTVLETDTNVPYGATPTYNGSTPTQDGQESTGWEPEVTTVTGDIIYTATYLPVYTVQFYSGPNSSNRGTSLGTVSVVQGRNATLPSTTPTHPNQVSEGDFIFIGWKPNPVNVQANMTCYAQYRDNRSVVVKYLEHTLEEVETSATDIAEYGLANQDNLTTIDLTSTSPVTIAANAFKDDTNLTHLIIRSTTMAILSNTSAFTGTKIADREGAIYVPTDLVDTYRADTNWKNYFIYPISSFKYSFEISDSWADIITAAENGTIGNLYNLGDYKTLSINNIDLQMQLVGLGEDDLADDSGKAASTWIVKNFKSLTHAMNSTATNADGWAASGMRDWLINTILPTIDSSISSHFKSVKKTYYNKTTSSTLSINDTIWIPSAREMFGGSSYENSGCDYTDFFSSDTARIKKNTSSADYYWLRSAGPSGSSYFRGVSSGGTVSYRNASSSGGAALGFCI